MPESANEHIEPVLPESPAAKPRPVEHHEPARLIEATREDSAATLYAQEIPPEYRANAERVVEEYLELKPGESVLFITDQNAHNTDPQLISLIEEVVSKKGGASTIFRIEGRKERHRQTPELQQLIAAHDVIWIASDIHKEKLPVDFETIANTLKETGKRMAHCTGLHAESLGNEGALAEPRRQMEERLNRMEERLRPVAGFHIENINGTDLWVEMKPKERRWFPDSGVIRPSKWDNLPGGEIFTTPNEERVNGTLVLTTLHHDVTPDRGVDQPVRLTIRNGKIVTIEGGESAEKLRSYLHTNSMIADDPWSVYSCAEIAFGANSKAVANEPCIGPDDWKKPGHSAVETEKRLGTMHIAFGNSKHGEEGTEGDNTAPTHLDFVLPQEGLTVRAFKDQASFNLAQRSSTTSKNDEFLIRNGKLMLI